MPETAGEFVKAKDYKYGKYLSTYIKNKSGHIRDFLAEYNKIRDDLLVEIDLEDEAGEELIDNKTQIDNE